MRLSVSGTANTGKSTLIKDIVQRWPIYTNPHVSYRDIIKSKNFTHSKQTNKDTQWAILNYMVDEMQKYDKNSNVIFDRNPLDNFVYTLWAEARGDGNIDLEFVQKCIPIIRESMKMLDIIFWIPFSGIPIQADSLRETDETYIKEIDNIFRAIYQQYLVNEEFPLFVKDDKPAIIEINGSREQRISLISEYIDDKGLPVAPDEQWAANLDTNASEIESKVSSLLKEQESESFREKLKLSN